MPTEHSSAAAHRAAADTAETNLGMRRDFDPEEVAARDVYSLLNRLVVPRPIAWVSTTSKDGVDNLAPHSFFTVSSSAPPVVQFTSIGYKDSLRNALETGEFVACLTPRSLIAQVNDSAIDFHPDEDEFELLGIEREPSARVKPPRVADSPACMECVLHDSLEIGSSTIVLGRVVHIAVDEQAFGERGPDIHKLDPIARLGGRDWSTIGEVLSLPRLPRSEWSAPDG